MIKYLVIAHAYVVISSLFLSSVPVGGVNGPATEHITYSRDAARRDDNPFSGARNITIDMEREEFTTPKAPIPYAEIWDNPLDQTAQQYVAILSMFEGKPLPEEIFRWIRMRQEQRFTETIRQGILTGRYATKPQEEKQLMPLEDVAGLSLLGFGAFLLILGFYLDRRHARQLREENSPKG